MKTLFSLPFLLFFALGAWGQTSVLYHNDYSESRAGAMNVNPDWAPFYHGVASGDPLEDRVVIWTRVTPEDLMNADTIEVNWFVATDPELENIVTNGTFNTYADRDYTVKVDVMGLASGTTYYYGFTALGKNSLTGRTKTTPTGAEANHLRFAIVSCNNFEAGYFNGFRRIADRNDLDAVIHLGDYIYEQRARTYGDPELWDSLRTIEPENKIVTLEEYRTRYSTYRLDSMMARVHQQHPFITVWDDHESANDAWKGGAEAHDPATDGSWEERLAVAKQVYYEWLPIRENQEQEIYRTISYGNIADLIMLDTRISGREQQNLNILDPAVQDTNRTILGAEQREWFLDQLKNSTAQWKLIGQQVIFSPFDIGWTFPLGGPVDNYVDAMAFGGVDIWNGYPAERTKVIDLIKQENIENVVILTGDYHTTFGFDVVDDPITITFQDTLGLDSVPFYTSNPGYDRNTGEGSVAVEFAGPSVTSANFDENFGVPLAEAGQFLFDIGLALIVDPVTMVPIADLGRPNPHLKFSELQEHGYFILDVKPEGVQADYFFTPIKTVSEEETNGKSFRSGTGNNRLQPASSPATEKAVQDLPAPADPPSELTTSVEDLERGAAILAVYPNPFSDSTTLHYSLTERSRVRIELVNANGQLVKVLLEETLPEGVYTLQTQAGELPAGTYIYRMLVGNKAQEAQVVLKK